MRPKVSNHSMTKTDFTVDVDEEDLLVQYLRYDGEYNLAVCIKCSIGKRADPNSVRPGTRPVGRYTERVSGWHCCHPLRIGCSSGGLRCRQNPTRVKAFEGRSELG